MIDIEEQREDIKILINQHFKQTNTITKKELIDFINNNSHDIADILCIPEWNTF